MIKLKDINKIYQTGDVYVHALKDINIDINKGEFVAILGSSGSGKSTLMNLLGCLDSPNSGTYHLDGIDVSKLDENSLAGIRNRKIGFIFQAFNLLPKLTAFENVELPMIYAKLDKKTRLKKANKALDMVGLLNRSAHKPNELSGGQKQRVAIARAMVNDPVILMADEPTGNLDSVSESEIIKIFKDLNDNGVTIIMVTHELEIGKNSKRVITFKDGEIINDQLNRSAYEF